MDVGAGGGDAGSRAPQLENWGEAEPLNFVHGTKSAPKIIQTFAGMSPPPPKNKNVCISDLAGQ